MLMEILHDPKLEIDASDSNIRILIRNEDTTAPEVQITDPTPAFSENHPPPTTDIITPTTIPPTTSPTDQPTESTTPKPSSSLTLAPSSNTTANSKSLETSPSATPKSVFRPTDETSTTTANPSLVFAPLVICGIFLLIWARRRKLVNSFAYSTDHNDTETLISTSVEASNEKVNSSVQYAPVDNPSDKWEDWEGETDGFSDDDFVNSSPVKITSPVASGPPKILRGLSTSSPPGSSSGRGRCSLVSPEPVNQMPFEPIGVCVPDRKPEVTLIDAIRSPNSSAREEASSSHASSDSFELLIPGESSSNVEEKSKEEDDMFSQLGMVPTFKKTDPKPSLSFPISSLTLASSSSSSNPFETFSSTPASCSTNIAASNSNSSSANGSRNLPSQNTNTLSSLGLDLDEVTADASGWGNDDDWDKGI